MNREKRCFPGLEGAMETPFITVCVNSEESQLAIRLPLGAAYRKLGKVLKKRFPESSLVGLDTFASYCREVYLLAANFETAFNHFLEIEVERPDMPYVGEVLSFTLGEITKTVDKPNLGQFARWHLLNELLGRDMENKYRELEKSSGRKVLLLYSSGSFGPNVILIKEENGRCRICVANNQGTLDEERSSPSS